MLSSSHTEMERLWKASSWSFFTSLFSFRPKISEATLSLSSAIMFTRSRNLSSTLPKLAIRSRSAVTKRRPLITCCLLSVPSGRMYFSRGLKASVSICLRASLSWVRRSLRMRRISSGMEASLYSTALSLSIVITSTAGCAPALRAWSMLASRRRMTLSSRPPLALRSIISFFIASGSPAFRTVCSVADAFWIRALIVSWMQLLREARLSLFSVSLCMRSFSRSRKRMSIRSYCASTALLNSSPVLARSLSISASYDMTAMSASSKVPRARPADSTSSLVTSPTFIACATIFCIRSVTASLSSTRVSFSSASLAFTILLSRKR
mmetsp:Transcript_37867/g.89604  ORF Transcript_37867/g.89604 Transcript_37867/m.89604 type:complete len:323 (+) Transcript_37867:197-1165(+)